MNPKYHSTSLLRALLLLECLSNMQILWCIALRTTLAKLDGHSDSSWQSCTNRPQQKSSNSIDGEWLGSELNYSKSCSLLLHVHTHFKCVAVVPLRQMDSTRDLTEAPNVKVCFVFTSCFHTGCWMGSKQMPADSVVHDVHLHLIKRTVLSHLARSKIDQTLILW
jgi:hypothetical protein